MYIHIDIHTKKLLCLQDMVKLDYWCKKNSVLQIAVKIASMCRLQDTLENGECSVWILLTQMRSMPFTVP